jgi:hypothetical protein
VQRIASEENFLEAGREFIHLGCWLLRYALQHINNLVIRIDVVQPAGHNQTLHDADVFCTQLGPIE